MNHVALHTIEICAGVGMLGEGLRAGLAHLGIQTRAVCFVEREAYPASVLAARMEEGSLDPAPVWPDLLTFDARRWAGAVDGIVAGFPCQDLSLAGRRAGLDGKRSGLFFDILDISDACGSWFLFLENVSGIASATASVVDEAEGALEERAASRVVGELAERGWHAEWLTLSASDVGASHGRERWFCFAWRPMVDAKCPERRAVGSTGAGCQQGHDGGRAEADRGAGEPVEVLGNSGLQHQYLQQRSEGAEHQGAGGSMANPSRDGRHEGRAQSGREQGRPDATECGCAMADTSSPGCQGRELGRALHGNRGGEEAHGPTEQLRGPFFAPGPADPAWGDILASRPWLAPALSIEEQHDAQAAFAAAQSDVHGEPDGVAARLDFDARAQRLKCCGNGVVALCAAAAAVVLLRRAGVNDMTAANYTERQALREAA